MITEFTYSDTSSMLVSNIDRSMKISEYVESDLLSNTKQVYKYIGSTNYKKSLAEKWSVIFGISPELELTGTMPRIITAHIKDLIWKLQKERLTNLL